jgi:hypothetical protein
MQELLAFSEDVRGNLAMRKYVLEFAANDSWGMLLLENRLFVVRYPAAKERLHKTSFVAVDEEKSTPSCSVRPPRAKVPSVALRPFIPCSPHYQPCNLNPSSSRKHSLRKNSGISRQKYSTHSSGRTRSEHREPIPSHVSTSPREEIVTKRVVCLWYLWYQPTPDWELTEKIGILMKSLIFALCAGLAFGGLSAQTPAWQPSPGHTQVSIWPGGGA